MHYRDGTEAHVGDIARGRGYNLPYEIVGPVTQLISANGDACNVRVETRRYRYIEATHDDGGGSPSQDVFETYEEAGRVADFELVHRCGWKRTEVAREVWLPEDTKGYTQDERGRSVRVLDGQA